MKISRAERRRRKFMVRKKHLDFLHCVLGWEVSDLAWKPRSRVSGDVHPLTNDLEHCRYWAKCVEYKTKRYNYQAIDMALVA